MADDERPDDCACADMKRVDIPCFACYRAGFEENPYDDPAPEYARCDDPTHDGACACGSDPDHAYESSRGI